MNENQLRPICEVLAQMTTGSNISYMLLSLGISCDLDDNATKWRRIYNAIVINWNKFHTNDMLIKIIEWIMSPALYIDKLYLYRNPKAHHLKYFCDDTYQSTLEALIIISRARYALGKCFRNNARYRRL